MRFLFNYRFCDFKMRMQDKFFAPTLLSIEHYDDTLTSNRQDDKNAYLKMYNGMLY